MMNALGANMWFTYFAGVALFLAILFTPGFLQCRAFSFGRVASFCFAPLLVVGEMALLGAILGLAGLSVPWFVVPAMGLVLSIVIYMAMRSRCKNVNLFTGLDCRLLLLYVATAFVVGMWFFVKNLDGPSSFVSEFDNAYHLNQIAAFALTGRYSFLQATIYPTVVAPMTDIAFYPAGWHVLCAFVASALGCDAAMVENIGIFAFVSFVLPSSMFAFLNVLFENDRKRVLCCTPFVLAFSSFPLGFLVAGPLYSNFAAMCLLPGAMSLFMALFAGWGKNAIIRLVPAFLFGLVSLVVTQPNTVFTAIIVLSPYAAVSIARLLFNAGHKREFSRAVAAVFLLLVLSVLILCYKMPFFSGVVHNGYQPYTATVGQAFVDFIDLGYRNTVSQSLVAFFVVVGMLALLAEKRQRWLLFSCVYFCAAYISAGAISGGLGGDFLSGFWYNDVDRIAANCSIVFIPLAGVGLSCVFDLIAYFYQTIAPQDGARLSKSVYLAMAGILVFLIFRPSYIDAGNGWINTAFGQRDSRLAELATSACSLDSEERDFLMRVKATVGNELVLNNPFDGSAFAYGIYDINLRNRHHFANGTLDDDLINQYLNEYIFRENVKEALNRLDANYVLVLDVEGYQGNTVYRDHYDEGKWSGVADINDSTPGFTVVLSDGDMRLYKIDDVS